MPYEEKWGNYADWVAAIGTVLGFIGAIVTIAFGRDQYLEEQARRFEEAFEVAAGVQARATVESAEGDQSLRWVYEVTNGTGLDLHDVQLFYPQPLSDEDDWFDVARVGSIEADTTKSFHQPLVSDHLTTARASSLIASQYSLDFTIEGIRWQLSKQGLRKALSSAQQAALRHARSKAHGPDLFAGS